MEKINAGYLYVMSHATDDNLVKIGFSNDPLRRLDELHQNSASPKKMGFEIIWNVSDMRLAEKLAHNRMREHRVSKNREFFYIVSPYSNLDTEFIDSDTMDAYKYALWDCIEDDFDYYRDQQEAGTFDSTELFKYQRVDIQTLYDLREQKRRLFGNEDPKGF